MKKILIFCIFLAFCACNGDSGEVLPAGQEHCISKEVVGTLHEVEGHIEQFEQIYLIQTSGQRYFACNLPEEYKSEGRSLRFDALEYRIPPNAKLMGIPIIITEVY